MAGDAVETLAAFDRARPGDHGELPTANAHLAHRNHCVLAVKLPAGELERLQDAMDMLDSRDGVEFLDARRVVVADQRDDGAKGPSDDPRLEAEFLDPLDGVFNLRLRGVGAENYDHK